MQKARAGVLVGAAMVTAAVIVSGGCGGPVKSPGPATVRATQASTPATPTRTTSAPARQGPLLVFQTNQGIMVVPRDGGTSAVLVPGNAAQHPDWSPDGSLVAYESDFSTVHTVASGGGEPTTVFSCSEPCQSVQDAAWSRDGTILAVAVAETADGTNTSRSAILAIDPATSKARTLYEDSSHRVWLFSPRWSPDGQSIVVEAATFATTRLDEERVTRVEVRVAPVAGKGKVRVLAGWVPNSSGHDAPSPDWSPTAALIVYSRGQNLHTVRPDGSGDRAITSYDGKVEHAIQATFTPDGSAITFTHVRGEFGVDDQPTAALIEVIGSSITRLAGGVTATHPRLAP